MKKGKKKEGRKRKRKIITERRSEYTQNQGFRLLGR